MKKLKFYFILLFTALICNTAISQKKMAKENSDPSLNSALFDNIKLRNIGPAFMSGRISDIAINPEDENQWYVAVASGGVWKTSNAGTTFEPIFDDQNVYSTGCVSIDPNDPFTIWLGTGENVGGRHISFGDGIYKSEDGGKSWNNMGLPNSEHISKILIHPDNSDIIWVASQGPLWNKGGDRGIFKSTDGGLSWTRTLGDDEWIGATDILMDPRNPDRLYAATWERHRTVAAIMDGGENSRIHISEDGGESWKKMEQGLPKGKWGKIGLALSPIDPDVLYAAIELNRRTGGVWRSEDQGRSWKKMSNAVAGATGPHYYQEIYACPHVFDRLYLMNNRFMRSDDGGKNFYNVNEKGKHGDNHSVSFKASDPDYLLVGTDGGVYESFDLGDSWRYMENLPLTQFYKLAVDDAEPFYNIYGGTQDNSTEGGPSRTDNLHGIRNSDWKVVLNWDGHQPATEPGNPDIIYAERQQGILSRIDMITGEVTDIQPQAAPGEDYERFNWDAPILVSPHSPTRIYFASQRLWRSDDRGDSWTSISDDLTKNEERLDLEIMGQKQSWDSPWDVLAMSNYNTITSISESPVKEGLIYVGTDDGLLQMTEDGGAKWKQIEVKDMNVPASAFINDIKADLFDENKVYVALDNHKYGDYNPYLVMSNDKGESWTSINKGLKEKHLVWRIVQDHIDKDLMFAGTEFGLFFTVDGAENWIELNGGVPTISFRDLAIQRRENDLVAASFGRGFFILDDYSAFRSIDNEMLNNEAVLFKPRDAYWYIPRSILSFDNTRGTQGSQLYVAPNPEFGANIYYYLKDKTLSMKESRLKKEEDGTVEFPGWDDLEKENREIKPFIFLEIRDSENNVVNRIKAEPEAGFNRINWDLKHAPKDIISLDKRNSFSSFMVEPGIYLAQLYKYHQGEVKVLSEPVEFLVKPLREAALRTNNMNEVSVFWRTYERLRSSANSFSIQLNKQGKILTNLFEAARYTNTDIDILSELSELKSDFDSLDIKWNGLRSKNEIGEKKLATVNERLSSIQRGIERSSYGPTNTHKESVDWINQDMTEMNTELQNINSDIKSIYKRLREAGGPLIEGID